ncbi:hypothetical protein Aspvir_001500 [Aspergillus viridinutans]|uniref:FAD-binding PCMH-type domain-containing protein n=1 Tax=Aspergillus viridinutans TaxID=75553 RepID=A0A9P3BSV5_ASPVI|nr:uncharacterized protein Aspvir_001500 [Aspergillus viridinutans]GIJ99370.1 hypothetical protein Aspvir_001500 [Aspergillus viridinutans]
MDSSGDKPSSVKDAFAKLQTAPPVQNRVDLFRRLIKDLVEDPVANPNIPNALFEKNWAKDSEVVDEDFIRQIIQSFKATRGDLWTHLLGTCTPNQSKMLEAFTANSKVHEIAHLFDFGCSRATREGFQNMERANQVQLSLPRNVEGGREAWEQRFKNKLEKLFHLRAETTPETVNIGLFEDPKRSTPVLTYEGAEFSNWGRTVENQPVYTCVPKTNYGIQQIVLYAANNNLGVRVSGYRHSWSPVFARDKGCMLISTLSLHQAAQLPNVESLDPLCPILFGDKPTLLNSITELGPLKEDPTKSLVRVGCATTNEQFRYWCVKTKRVTLPLNVIMVEITFGGSNGPICHGAGIRHKTLSDLVYAIEYVDVHGKLQIITRADDDFLSAASGCFGLLGVVTHITLVVDKMTYAAMTPQKQAVIDAIPPPDSLRSRVPPPLNQPRTPEQIRRAQEEFEKKAAEEYYAEWFWFPYSDEVWINTWSTTPDPLGVQDYPDNEEIAVQWLQAVAIEALQYLAKDTNTAEILPLLRTTAVSRLGMASLPAGKEIKAWLPDALHFRRAIQNTRVRDMELEIPLPHQSDNLDKPDFTIVQHAWWEAIIKAYEHTDKCPMRLPLELRIMGDSNVLMAPQRGNRLGTASIEVLTLESVTEYWDAFAQEVLDRWMELREWKGQKLNIRPHWAKEWQQFKVDGKPFREYLKEECYGDVIPKFNKVLAQIGQTQGWQRQDLKRVFSNGLFDYIFFDDINA